MGIQYTLNAIDFTFFSKSRECTFLFLENLIKTKSSNTVFNILKKLSSMLNF